MEIQATAPVVIFSADATRGQVMTLLDLGAQNFDGIDYPPLKCAATIALVILNGGMARDTRG
jgi:hypothetical protein